GSGGSSLGRHSRRGGIQRGARRTGDRLERFRLPDREIGQHLAVEVEPGELNAVHELRVGQAMLARAGIDALDPQGAEVAFAVASVSVGIAQRLFDLLDGDTISGAAATAVSFGKIK